MGYRDLVRHRNFLPVGFVLWVWYSFAAAESPSINRINPAPPKRELQVRVLVGTPPTLRCFRYENGQQSPLPNTTTLHMNLLLLEAHQFQSATEATLSERQTRHIQQVLKARTGSLLKVGVIDGKLGYGCLHQTDGGWRLTDIQLDTAPPAPLPLSLVLALPRPQMIKRILQTAACMGVARIHLLQTAKVEKSFWQSPAVTESAIREQLILGLEQAGATQLPQVEKHCRFRPFAEDALPGIADGHTKLIAHPGDYPACPRLAKNETAVLAIGPEGGFTEGEVSYFLNEGFAAFQLGPRILKVETAVPVTLAKLY